MVHPDSGVSFAVKQSEDQAMRDKTQLKSVLLRERNQPEMLHRCDSDHMKFWKGLNYGDSSKISNFQGLKGGRGE